MGAPICRTEGDLITDGAVHYIDVGLMVCALRLLASSLFPDFGKNGRAPVTPACTTKNAVGFMLILRADS